MGISHQTQEMTFNGNTSNLVLEQKILGSKKTSNLIIGSAVSIGGLGFILASVSSFLGKDLLPLGHPSTLIFVPQGLIMGLYGIAAILLSLYLWALVTIDYGGGFNRFDKNSGLITINRRALFKTIQVDIAIKDVTAIKLEVRDGLNPKRNISLRVKGRKDIPITRVGEPIPLIQLEKQGAELARFIGVNLESQ